MPSFAKKPVDSKSGGLADVFSDEEVKEVLQVSRQCFRVAQRAHGDLLPADGQGRS